MSSDSGFLKFHQKGMKIVCQNIICSIFEDHYQRVPVLLLLFHFVFKHFQLSYIATLFQLLTCLRKQHLTSDDDINNNQHNDNK